MGQPDIGADDRALSDDCFPAQNGGTGVDGDIILDGGMPLGIGGILGDG